MAKLSDEEKATLEALTAKANSADDEDDFDVDWWEEGPDGTRRGGRIPWSKGKSIYGKHFPDLFGDKPPSDGKDDPKDDGKGKGGTATKYFGKKDE